MKQIWKEAAKTVPVAIVLVGVATGPAPGQLGRVTN